MLKALLMSYHLKAPTLLLVFRMNASYAMFVDGKNWRLRVMANADDLTVLVMRIEENLMVVMMGGLEERP